MTLKVERSIILIHTYMKKKIFLSSLVLFTPLLSFAAGPGVSRCDASKIGPPFKGLGSIVDYATCTLVGSVIPLLFTLATAGFIWGIIQYFLNPENEEKRSQGKGYMLWGIIALFVMVSMWGLVGVLGNTFGVKTLLPQLSQ
jgi:Type IV secretion system pilin